MARELPRQASGDPKERKRLDLHILAVDDDPEFLLSLKVGLQRLCRLTTAQNLKEAFVLLAANGIDMVLLDIGLGSESGLEALKAIKEKNSDRDVVIVSGHKDPKMVVEAIRNGASDYLVKPFEIEELIAVIEKVRPYRLMREKHEALLEGMNRLGAPMIGESGGFRGMLEKAAQVKGHRATVLIEGESGTGKELLARYIYGLEGNTRRPFVAVNCAAIPDNLLESELFGHEKGSFSGAESRKIGKFEVAQGGDLFLDEISCLKPDLQAKLLRAIEEKEITRVGGNEPIRLNIRIITATNDDLGKLVESGKFRHDLYHRLRIITLRLPPLRERREDIPVLIEHFFNKHASRRRFRFSLPAISVIQSYPWPGNIRELENLIQSLVILIPDREITREDLPSWIFETRGASGNLSSRDFILPIERSGMIPLREYVGKAERAYIERALEIAKGDKSKAASILNMSRTRLYERLKNWGINESSDN